MQFTPMLGRAMAGEEDNVDDNSRNRTCASRKNSSRATTTTTTSATNTTTTTTGYHAGGSSNNNSTAVSRSHTQRGSAHAHEGHVTPLSSIPPSKETSAGVICDEAQSLGELEGIFHASHGRDALLTGVVHAPAVDNVGLVEPDEAVVRPDSPYCVEVETGMVMTLVHPCMEPVHVRLLQLQRAIRHEAARLHALRRRAQQFHQNAYPAIELETVSVENGSLASTTTASASRDHSARNHNYSSHQGSSARRSSSTSSSSSSSSSGNHVHRPHDTGNERQANHNVSTAEDDSAEAKLLRDCMTSIYLGQAIPKPTLGRNNNAKAHEKEAGQTAPQPSPQLQPVAPLHNAHVDESGEDDDEEEEEDDEVESVGSREEGKSGSGGGRQRRPALQPLSSQELVQLRQSSQRLALLYRQRGIYLRRMDALLRQHANCNERWESNEERTTCYRCHRPFSALTRRHHCRRCGRLCCAECSCHFGKKQDTSCLPPSQSEDHIAAPTLYLSNHHTTSNVSLPYRPHSVVRTEYAVRLTEADTGVDPEERYDSYTYPNAHAVHEGNTISNTDVVRQGSKTVQRRSRTRRQGKAGRHAHGNCHTGSVSTALTHLQEEQGHDTTSTSNTRRAHVDDLQDEQQAALVTTQQQVPLLASHPSGLKHHEWVRICTTCYNNCLRARKTDILKRTKNANRCILDDGYYYFYVLTADELHCVGTLMDKPDSLRKQVELQSCALLERSADYIVGVPSYGTRMLTSAAQQTPQVLRTLGSMSLYAARRARKAATDCVETYLVTREASTRQARQPPHVDTMAEPEAQEHDRSNSDEDGEAVLSPAADAQASDGENNANTSAQCAANDL